MSKTNSKIEAIAGDTNAPIAKSKSKFERIEPGLFRYKPSGVYYSVLKQAGKTTWKNLHTTDKPTARRIVARERENQTTLDSNLSGLEFGELTNNYLGSNAYMPTFHLTRKCAILNVKNLFEVIVFSIIGIT